MYASAVCSGKVKPGGKKRTKKANGGSVNKIATGCGKVANNRRKQTTYVAMA